MVLHTILMVGRSIDDFYALMRHNMEMKARTVFNATAGSNYQNLSITVDPPGYVR